MDILSARQKEKEVWLSLFFKAREFVRLKTQSKLTRRVEMISADMYSLADEHGPPKPRRVVEENGLPPVKSQVLCLLGGNLIGFLEVDVTPKGVRCETGCRQKAGSNTQRYDTICTNKPSLLDGCIRRGLQSKPAKQKQRCLSRGGGQIRSLVHPVGQ